MIDSISGLYLCKTPGKNYGLHLVNSSAKNYLALKYVVRNNFFIGLNPFQQSDSDPMSSLWEQKEDYEVNKENVKFNHTYLFIEFWSDDYNLMIEKSMEFANSIDEELKLEDF
jgi:hypothetical protein